MPIQNPIQASDARAVFPSLLMIFCGFLAMEIADAAKKNGFDTTGALVPQRQILKGGPPRDGIPAIDEPQFVNASAAPFVAPDDRVLGLNHNGVVRAYPIKILNYHEIVNDILNGQPAVITYCPLCGSGMAFSSMLGNRSFTFGVSGLLYNSDVLLYDRQTESLWSQLKRQAISGHMQGEMLDALPVTHTTWRDWYQKYPDTQVLSPVTGYMRNYDVDPYPGYSQSGRVYFPVTKESSRYPRKALVMGLEIDGQFKAYPFEEMADGSGRIQDNFQGTAIEITFDRENQTASAYDADGTELPTVLAFWFAWYAFHPDTEVYPD